MQDFIAQIFLVDKRVCSSSTSDLEQENCNDAVNKLKSRTFGSTTSLVVGRSRFQKEQTYKTDVICDPFDFQNIV